jgi:light-regulated signal transduction histidine kinase (bacteriophytochrome)
VAEPDREAALTLIQKIKQGEIVKSFELRRLAKDGRVLDVWLTTTLLRDEIGSPVAIATTERDITERKLAEKEISELNAGLERRVIERTTQLEAANKELEAFSYSVSHDLRAPLRSIDGFSQVLLEDYMDKLDAAGQDALKRVRAAAQRMAQLIDDMLKLSRVTRSEMRLETVDLSAMAHAVLAELQRTQPERQVDCDIAEGIVAKGDTQLLRAVLENLLGNAWKFTGKQSCARIEFGKTQHEGETTYFVRDNGAGFDMAFVNKLFGAFQRLHPVEEFPGTGIGLATVQRIIHRHGGRVWAEGALAQGATFYFTLPGEAI